MFAFALAITALNFPALLILIGGFYLMNQSKIPFTFSTPQIVFFIAAIVGIALAEKAGIFARGSLIPVQLLIANPHTTRQQNNKWLYLSTFSFLVFTISSSFCYAKECLFFFSEPSMYALDTDPFIWESVFVPVAEEFYFRGFLFLLLARLVGVRFGVLLSSLAFGFIHWPLERAFLSAIFGAYLAILLWESRSLVFAIVGHAFLNSGAAFYYANTLAQIVSEKFFIYLLISSVLFLPFWLRKRIVNDRNVERFVIIFFFGSLPSYLLLWVRWLGWGIFVF